MSTGYPPYNYRIDQYHVAPAVVFDTLYAAVGGRILSAIPKRRNMNYHWRNYQILQTTTTESEKRSHHISYTIDYSTSYYKDAVENTTMYLRPSKKSV